MKERYLLSHLALCSLFIYGLHAEETDYDSALKAGESSQQQGSYDQALENFTTAANLAENDTQKALAWSKQAYVLAFQKIDYAKAREAAETALAFVGSEPVGHVTALQALAECQRNEGTGNPLGAAETLRKALELAGVEWAKPRIALALGDCYRETDTPDKALSAYRSVLAMTAADAGTKAVAHLNIGLTRQYNLSEPEAARAAYAEAVALNEALSEEVSFHLAKLNN